VIVITALLVASAVAARAAHLASTRSRALDHVEVTTRAALPPIVRRLVSPLLHGRVDRAVERELPVALDAVARSLRSGASLRQAVGEAADAVPGPLGADLGRVDVALAHGDPLVIALDRWLSARALPGVRLAVAALSLGAEAGGASAQAVDGVAATLRTNLDVAAEVRALSSQARLSALVIALAPVAFSLLAATTDGSTASFLLRTPLGLVCLAIGLGLDAVGFLWMRRIAAGVA